MKYFQELKHVKKYQILGTSVGALKASYHHVKKLNGVAKRLNLFQIIESKQYHERI
jgi:hypothetical protein